MTLKQVSVLCLIVAVLSAAVTRYYFPQIQTKTVEVTKEVVKTDVRTVVHTVTSPNGTVDSTTTVIDHSTKTETEHKTSVTMAEKNWNVSGFIESNFHLEAPSYGVHIQRKVLGPLSLGVLTNTKGDVGLSIGVTF